MKLVITTITKDGMTVETPTPSTKVKLPDTMTAQEVTARIQAARNAAAVSKGESR